MSQLQSLLDRMRNPDHDFRFMALNDLIAETNKPSFHLDATTEERLVDSVLALVNDGNTEVKNHAVKAIGAIVKKVQEPRMLTIIDQMISYTTSKDEQLRDIANLVIREIQPSSALGVNVCTKLAPKLISQLQSDAQLGSAELLADLFARFDTTSTSALQALLPLLTSQRAAVRKRAIDALGYLAACSSDEVTSTLIRGTVVPQISASDAEQLKTGVNLVNAIVNRAPQTGGKRLAELVPKIIAVANSSAAQGDDELRESVLQALERILLKCPREATAYVNSITELAATLIKYDPNLAGGDDEDEGGDAEMEDAEEDEYDDEAYSDDDDVSWKVRRAATKVLAAAVETRPDQLIAFYRTISPVLISRFSEREETVRLEIWQTYTKLLELTRIYGDVVLPTVSATSSDSSSGQSLKRKRGGSSSQASRGASLNGTAAMDVDEQTPTSLLRSAAPAIARSITKQLGAKSVAVRQAGFALLRALLDVLHGDLDDFLSPLLPRIAASLSVADAGVSGTGTALKIETLAFLTAVFETHSITVLKPLLGSLVPQLVKTCNDKFNRVAADALVTSAALVRVMRSMPKPGQPIAQQAVGSLDSELTTELGKIYEVTIGRLGASATDQEVRESSIVCLGDLLYHAGDALAHDFTRSLTLLREAMRREVTRIAAVRTTGRIAQSPVCTTQPTFQQWAQEVLADVAPLLRQANRVVRAEAFAALPPLLVSIGQGLSPAAAETVLAAVQGFLSADDLQAVPMALAVVRTLLDVQPNLGPSDAFQQQVMPSIYALARSPAVTGIVLDSLIQLFVATVRSGAEPVPILDALSGPALSSEGKGKSTAVAQKTTFATASRCIGAIVHEQPVLADNVANGLVTQLGKKDTPPSAVAFCLLTLGEIGRFAEFKQRKKAFDKALTLFGSSADEIRSAAAFAVGNMAVGSADDLLPSIISKIGGKADEKTRSLALQALKEFITHSDAATLAPRSDALWDPLFEICAVDGLAPAEPGLAEGASEADKKARDKRVEKQWKANEPIREQWKATEAARNIAAECLGKIALTNPIRYLPLLQTRLSDDSAGIRAAVIAAVRFTFTDDSASYDVVLAPQLINFLPMRDPDLNVRRLALSTLNSAAHHKPHLLRPSLPALLPQLYEETVVNPDLIRIVEMGPFKHRVDDGLDVRKAAYEAAYTLLDTCTSSLQMHDLLVRVNAGVSDDNEIRAISYLMLIKLAQVAPTAVAQSMDILVEPFAKTLNEKLKDGTVKQEQEKHEQMQKSALRAFVALQKLSSPGVTPRYCKLFEELKSGSYSKDVADLTSERAHGDQMDVDA